MNKSRVQTLFHFFAASRAIKFFSTVYFFIREFFAHEETFWDRRPFENPLEKADDLCEIGYTFQKNEIIYKKISEKKWFAEILIPDDDQFEIDHESEIENDIYQKIGEKAWTIERLD